MGLLNWYVRGVAIDALLEHERSNVARLGPAQAEAARQAGNLRQPEYNEHGAMHRSSRQIPPERRLPSKPSAQFLRDILKKRQLPDKNGMTGDQRAKIALGMLDAGQLSQADVGKAIDAYKRLPLKAQLRADQGPSIVIPGTEQVPKGWYAIENAQGELRFYRVWRGDRNPDYVRIYVQHGPEESQVPWNVATYASLLNAIVEVGPYEAATRYGREIGCCSQCHLRLTNRLSRELGIGPICGGRFFEGDPAEWRRRQSRMRDVIRARGEDPEESIE